MRSMEEARGIHEWCERACSFGRFKGAARYIPYLWGIANMEESEEYVEWDGSIRITVTPEDTFIFPELEGRNVVILKQDFKTALVQEVVP